MIHSQCLQEHTINGNVDDVTKLFDFPFVTKPSSVSGNGVWSTKLIAKHSILGAFNGKSVTQTAKFSRFPYMWEVYRLLLLTLLFVMTLGIAVIILVLLLWPAWQKAQ